MEDLTSKAQEYKSKLGALETQKNDLEKQVIILDEQYKQYKDTIEKAFKTTDPEELRKIAESYLSDIQILEEQLGTGNVTL